MGAERRRRHEREREVWRRRMGGSGAQRAGARGGRPAKARMGEGRPRLVAVDDVTVSLRLDDVYLSMKALAHYTGLSRRKLQDLLNDPAHPLPHYRIGGKILVRRGEYDAWARRYRQVGRPDVERIVGEVFRDL